MANFLPLKNYMFYCLDHMIERFNLQEPFLDIGCGIGDVSRYVARKGWKGRAIDYSDVAINQAKINLRDFPSVEVSKKNFSDENGRYKTIFLWDVIEHIEDDTALLKKISSLLEPGGQLVIAVPSNPREWRWDDVFYGHYRRYTLDDMKQKLVVSGLEPLAFWDFTYPVFWIMRRMYTFLKRPRTVEDNKDKNTAMSSTVNAWDIPIISKIFNKVQFVWKPIFALQFLWFKDKVGYGHEMFVVARKP